jgi:hypothetical protein
MTRLAIEDSRIQGKDPPCYLLEWFEEKSMAETQQQFEAKTK